MDEYIKKDEYCENYCRCSNEYCDKESCSIWKAPSADVAPVRHGRWIDKGEYAVCMECGGRSGTQYDGVEPIPLMTQFCPNCGAIMDGGAE